MSTIGVKHHNEDIHNIIHKLASPTVKSPRYKSQKKLAISIEWSPKKKYNGHQTFGLAHYEAPQFKNYLKKAKPRTELPPVKITGKLPILKLKKKRKELSVLCALHK